MSRTLVNTLPNIVFAKPLVHSELLSSGKEGEGEGDFESVAIRNLSTQPPGWKMEEGVREGAGRGWRLRRTKTLMSVRYWRERHCLYNRPGFKKIFLSLWNGRKRTQNQHSRQDQSEKTVGSWKYSKVTSRCSWSFTTSVLWPRNKYKKNRADVLSSSASLTYVYVWSRVEIFFVTQPAVYRFIHFFRECRQIDRAFSHSGGNPYATDNTTKPVGSCYSRFEQAPARTNETEYPWNRAR